MFCTLLFNLVFFRFWSRGKGACKKIDHFDDPEAAKYSANHVVFTFQMPLPRDSKLFKYFIKVYIFWESHINI